MNPNENMTFHFTLSEALFSSTAERLGIDNTPTDTIVANMKLAAQGMEQVRTLLNTPSASASPVPEHPIHIDSWYRCPALNKAVGGAADSAHMEGYAVDFLCRPYSIDDIIQAIAASPIDFDKIIQEGTWVHISFDPQLRRELWQAHFGPGGTTYTPYAVDAV